MEKEKANESDEKKGKERKGKVSCLQKEKMEELRMRADSEERRGKKERKKEREKGLLHFKENRWNEENGRRDLGLSEGQKKREENKTR